MRVFIYWNLHRSCWSIKALEGAHKGRVVAHARAWCLSNGVQFKVSEAGRQRVLREQRKNVHAGAVGTLTGWQSVATMTGAGPLEALHNREAFEDENVQACNASPWAWGITYSPYKAPTFTRVADGQPVTGGRSAWAVGRRVTALLDVRRTD